MTVVGALGEIDRTLQAKRERRSYCNTQITPPKICHLSIKYSPPVGLQKLPPLRRTAAVVSWVHSSHNGFQWRPTVMAKNV